MTRADFSDLVKSLSRKLYVYAYRILKNQESAEDAVQEVFLKLWKMNKRIGEYRSVDALATTMVKNHCIDQVRKANFKTNESLDHYVQHSAAEPTPYEQMERNETISIMDKIIKMLPENYSELIKLRDIDGLSYEEISDITKLNINVLRVTLSRARKMVRNEFIKYSYEQRGNKEAAGEIL